MQVSKQLGAGGKQWVQMLVPPASTNRLCKSKRSPLDSDSGYYNHSDYNIVDADHQLKQVPIHLTMQVPK